MCFQPRSRNYELAEFFSVLAKIDPDSAMLAFGGFVCIHSQAPVTQFGFRDAQATDVASGQAD